MSTICLNLNLIHCVIQYPISLFFQCKIDKMILFHAVAKASQNFLGGTPLKKELGKYVHSWIRKYKVSKSGNYVITVVSCYCNIVLCAIICCSLSEID